MSDETAFSVPMMFHPSHDVFDLDEAERFYEKIFGCSSTSLKSLSDQLPAKPGSGYPDDYSTFTPIQDVLFDTIDPSRYVFDGVQKLPSIDEAHLRMIVWYAENMDDLYRHLRHGGLRLMDQLNQIVEGDAAPTSYGSKMNLMFTLPEETGLRYGLFPPAFGGLTDPRVRPGWKYRGVSADDPLGLERCSYHTILTDTPEKALGFHALLGGKVIHEARNELLGANCTYLHLADSILEIAVPDAGTEAHRDWQKRAPHDTYHSLTWKVVDLEKAERHLTAHGVGIASRSDDLIICDPATSLGIPWGFSSKLVAGDPRSATK